MKKKIKSNPKRFINFFDKIVINPITKILVKITEFQKNNNNYFERLLNNKQVLIVLSLILTFITYYAIDQKIVVLVDNSVEILYNLPVEVDYNEEAYVIEGIPDTVDMTLIGRKADLYLAKQYPSHIITADLTNLKLGTHKVSLKYNQVISSITYKLDPSVITVVIYDKISKTREVEVSLLHKELLDTKLVIDSVKLDRSEVIIKGAEYKLSEVAYVKALVDINNIKNPAPGEITLKDIPLVAYDASSNIIDVEIVPAKVTASITISSPSKTVPIKLIPIGDLAVGKAISALKSNVPTVTLYGDQETLDNISTFPIEIDVAGLAENKTFNLNLTKPSGIRALSVDKITVNITLDSVITKEIENITIVTKNVETGLKAYAINKENSIITVIVKGSKNVIDKLDESNIIAYVDLSGYDVGEHDVKVSIDGPDKTLNYKSKVTTVKIKIVKN
ncbi:MAG: hypothetical protein GX861_02625 [Tenericutes bacterium]|jgi:YbbR domain-containing protein|nr:hypothetical protein [Mycoplasmatota bacterium]